MLNIRSVFACLALSIMGSSALAQRSTPVQLLQPSGAAGDSFGYAVAVDGDTMVVGAFADDVGGKADQGSAHVYRWTGTGWAFEATLTATGGTTGDYFGISVAISGDTVIVGALFDDVGAIANQGSAYVFTRTPGGTTWTQQAQLNAATGATNDGFGTSVAISGDTAIVGALRVDVGANADQGSAVVFTRSGTTWTQQAQLTAIDGAAGDSFGRAVAISGDTAIVGADFDDVGVNSNQGSAIVFTRSGTTWTQQAQLTATGGEGNDYFGWSVALSGDTVIVGARNDQVAGNVAQGSATVFVRPPGGTIWTQQAELTATDGAELDQFGWSVAISGDTAIVGAPFDDVGATIDQGSAGVFTRSGTTWTQRAQLTATSGADSDYMGYFVALSGDTAVVGAWQNDVGANANQGSAWVFSRVGSTWIGPDFQAVSSAGADGRNFGWSAAISGDTAVIGAYSDSVDGNDSQGSAYVFVRTGSAWIQQARLTPLGGAAGDRFGSSVAISGDTVVVGAYLDDVGANADQGSAYVFTRSGATWTQQAQLSATGGAPGDFFGYSVALSGDSAIVGAYLDDVGAMSDQGSAYVFTRSGITWTQQAQLNAVGGAAGDQFGFSVALSGDTAIVGAYLDDVGANSNQGSAYVLTRSGTTWTQQAQLNATGGAAGDQFGFSVALSGDTAIVGAYLDDVGATSNQGSASVFTRSGTTWTQQAQLTASAGAANDSFGRSVTLSGDTAIVGAYLDDVGTNTDQGSAYIFTRASTTWTQQAQLTAPDGLPNDVFGTSVALSGDTAVVGVPLDDLADSDYGSAWFFDFATTDFSFTRNEMTGVSYSALASALAAVQSGQAINASEGAWRTATAIDTAGRSLSLRGSGDVRTPSTCAVTLGGASILSTPTQNFMDIFGSLSVPASQFATVSSGAFRLGSRGQLRLFTNSQLTIDAPQASIDAATQLDARAELNLRGNATVWGDLTAALYSDVSALGSLTNFGAWSVTSGSIGANLFTNRAQLSVLGTSGIFGDFTNEAGATTTITSGRLFVVGTFTNNGTINGAVCSNCLGSPPALEADGDLNLGAAANLSMPFGGALVRVGGDFNCAINSNTRFDMSLATLQLEGVGGAGVEQTLEVMSADIGRNVLGLDRSLEGHYPIGTLHIGPSASTVRLVDAHDNDGMGQDSCEAIYVDTLRIDAGSRLINTSCRIYYNTLINEGEVDVPTNLLSLTCPADIDGVPGVDFGDFLAFFNCYDASDACGDIDGVPGTDFGDFLAFFNSYDAGC
jgi:hypothetical protein